MTTPKVTTIETSETEKTIETSETEKTISKVETETYDDGDESDSEMSLADFDALVEDQVDRTPPTKWRDLKIGKVYTAVDMFTFVKNKKYNPEGNEKTAVITLKNGTRVWASTGIQRDISIGKNRGFKMPCYFQSLGLKDKKNGSKPYFDHKFAWCPKVNKKLSKKK